MPLAAFEREQKGLSLVTTFRNPNYKVNLLPGGI